MGPAYGCVSYAKLHAALVKYPSSLCNFINCVPLGLEKLKDKKVKKKIESLIFLSLNPQFVIFGLLVSNFVYKKLYLLQLID